MGIFTAAATPYERKKARGVSYRAIYLTGHQAVPDVKSLELTSLEQQLQRPSWQHQQQR